MNEIIMNIPIHSNSIPIKKFIFSFWKKFEQPIASKKEALDLWLFFRLELDDDRFDVIFGFYYGNFTFVRKGNKKSTSF